MKSSKTSFLRNCISGWNVRHFVQPQNLCGNESMASEVLYRDLHFSKYDTLVSVLENEFEKELPSPLPERLAPILLKNRAIQETFDKYNLTDEFVATPEYDTLYTELTGTVVLLIEANQLPTIGDVSALE